MAASPPSAGTYTLDTYVTGIRSLATKALERVPEGSRSWEEALHRRWVPVDYMRCAEFPAASALLSLAPGMRVLDISSPQWFTLCNAHWNPSVAFDYCNILSDELDQVRLIAEALQIRNLRFVRQDARAVAVAGQQYDRVVSISVLEHIAPVEGGDLLALREITRVLRPGAEFALTLPMKAKASVLYVDGPVYERSGNSNTFFAREYDQRQLDKLLERAGLRAAKTLYICERPGVLAMDHWEYGPGRGSRRAAQARRLKALLDRLARRSLDDRLARRYLRWGTSQCGRTVNVAVLVRRIAADGHGGV